MANFDMSQILNDKRSSCDIMQVKLFTKLGMRQETLIPYMKTYLQGFKTTVTPPLEYNQIVGYH